MALSVGFRVSVSLHPATQATGLRLLPRWDCLPLSVPAFSGRTGLLSVHSRYNLQTRQVALCDLLHRRLRRLCCLHRRSNCYRVERSSSRAGLSPAVVQRLSRRTVIGMLRQQSRRSPQVSGSRGLCQAAPRRTEETIFPARSRARCRCSTIRTSGLAVR